MLVRLVGGLLITAVCLAIAGRRIFFLYRMIASGQPSPGRLDGWPQRLLGQVVEVFGQVRLLKWNVPGVAHFFVFWGFLILGATILEGYLPGERFPNTGKRGEYGAMCMLGTFSQYGVIHQNSCVKVDDDLPLEKAVLVGCGVPTGWGSAVNTANVRPGQTVMVSPSWCQTADVSGGGVTGSLWSRDDRTAQCGAIVQRQHVPDDEEQPWSSSRST